MLSHRRFNHQDIRKDIFKSLNRKRRKETLQQSVTDFWSFRWRRLW